jgi:hypothetical protein
MRYVGHTYRSEQRFRVKEAVATAARISVDFDEDGLPGHLEASSTDGQLYVGNYGYPQLDTANRTQLKLFKAKDGTLLLLGPWKDRDGTEGEWFILLRPEGKQ